MNLGPECLQCGLAQDWDHTRFGCDNRPETPMCNGCGIRRTVPCGTRFCPLDGEAQ